MIENLTRMCYTEKQIGFTLGNLKQGGNVLTQGKSVLELTTRIGEVLLKNGGEIFRVQQTMQIVAKAYGVSGFHVYVLANGLFGRRDRTGRAGGCQPDSPCTAVIGPSRQGSGGQQPFPRDCRT